jgi:hypothetical protein
METRYNNEFGEEIPEHIAEKAREMNCIKPKYIYRDGQYHGKFPAASIGCTKATRFRNAANAESHKVNLGDGWVVFKSPSSAGSKRGW